MINQINSTLSKVDYILHVADIHIRNWKRHREYQEVFDKLYAAVDSLPANSIVTVGGDVAHAKTDMSPELISMITGFLQQLGDRRPTILIAGNHDTNLNNNQRLDVLTPIVEALKHPNVFYLRNSGTYQIGDLDIGVMSLLDDKQTYPLISSVDPTRSRRRIAMYHGTIANSKVDSGLNIAHGLNWDVFAGYDIVLLGDIHKRQVQSQSDPLMFYPGSLIQQNFGESFEGHGFALVDLTQPDPKLSLHDIPNQYGFFTIDVVDGVVPPNLPINSRTNVRIKSKGTTPNQLKEILHNLRKQYGVAEVSINNLDGLGKTGISNQVGDGIYQGDIRSPQVQRQLLANYYKDNPLSDELTDQILQLSDQLNSQLNHPEVARGTVWKPRRFEFSNMFSYGENNVIDFTKMKGTCGLFAPNHTGKSSILDALCFCLFDYTSRAGKAEHVLNNKSDWFSCQFEFELEGLVYTIKKQASRYKKGPLAGRLRVDIDFWYVNAEGATVSLNGEQRRDTDRIIQSYIGTFNDFVLTALSMQGNSSNFVEKTQGERKELLANFLDLATFDQLFELANREVKTLVVLLENHQRQDYSSQIIELEAKLDQLDSDRTKQQADVDVAQAVVDQLNQNLNNLNKELLPVRYRGSSVEDLNDAKQRLNSQITERQSMIEKLQQLLQTQSSLVSLQESELAGAKKAFNVEAYTRLGQDRQLLGSMMDRLSKIDLMIPTMQAKLDMLHQHQYDPNCKYCVANAFVKDALDTKAALELDQEQRKQLLSEIESLRQQIELNAPLEDQLKSIQDLDVDLTTNRKLLDDTNSQLHIERLKLSSLNDNLREVGLQIEAYQADKLQLLANEQINLKIEAEKLLLQQATAKLTQAQQKYNRAYADLQIGIHNLSSLKKASSEVDNLLKKLELYEAYCKAVSKDGIPYDLISKAVPYIQNYVNNILSQIVEFQVTLETDGKNINAFIGYDDQKWPLELASGMERFVSSLAIRIALIKTTNLPKPDFIAIDEGLGVLDSSNLNSMHTLFTYMKDVFKFSLIISHIDVVRDMVDNILNIDRREGFSCIRV